MQRIKVAAENPLGANPSDIVEAEYGRLKPHEKSAMKKKESIKKFAQRVRNKIKPKKKRPKKFEEVILPWS